MVDRETEGSLDNPTRPVSNRGPTDKYPTFEVGSARIRARDNYEICAQLTI